MKDQLVICLLEILLSVESSAILESLRQIKTLLSGLSTQEEVSRLLLNDLQALPLLALTLSFNEFSHTAITIFLALSFSQEHSEQFTHQMTSEAVTFEILQHSMIQHRHAQIFEDFVVIVQKLSSKDPSSVKSLMSSKLVEILNTEMVKKG